MAYERCVRKKMRSLFEYLDTDHDGRITQECLLQGLHRLKSSELTTTTTTADPASREEELSEEKEHALQYEICEYEANELIRNVPEADAEGGITLKTFLEAESTLLPRLTKLRLLQ